MFISVHCKTKKRSVSLKKGGIHRKRAYQCSQNTYAKVNLFR